MLNALWRNFSLKSSTINAIVATFLLVFGNAAFWQQFLVAYPLTMQNLPFALGMLLLLWGLFYFCLTLISWPFVYKPVVIVLLTLTAISAYAMDSFGYVISSYSFVNLVETDSNEIHDLLSFKLLLYITCLAIVPSILISMLKIRYTNLKNKLLHITLILILLLLDVLLFNKTYTSFLRNHKEVRYYINPVRTVYSLTKFIAQHLGTNVTTAFQIMDEAPSIARQLSKPRLIVLVVGESDRAINHALNGYKRNTNPLLALRKNVYSFKEFYSCGTETSVSVPCMFSSFKRADFNYTKGRYTENLLDILQKSQVKVVWRDNDSGCKNVCDRVTVEDLNNAKDQDYCRDGECLDEVLLQNLAAHITDEVQDKLIVLHKKGNHGPAYYKRYPQRFEVFTPTCKSNELQDCTNEQIVNTYDNIVLYTDYFLNEVITLLEKHNDQYQTAMIYVSDHGESLGEHGIYLHAMPYWLAPKEQTHIPFVVWFSDDFVVDRSKFTTLEQQTLSHDNLYHTMLGLYGVQSKTYDASLDFFNIAKNSSGFISG